MKAETSETVEVPKSGENTVVATPDSASQAGTEGDSGSGSESGDADAETATSASHTASSSTATVVAPTSASIKGKGKVASVTEISQKTETPEPPRSKGKNLVGRINNLVSSDLSSLENISMYIVFSSASSGCGGLALADARNAIPPAIESPFQITLCIIFLYQIMGWRYARLAPLFFSGTDWMVDTLQRPGRVCSHAPDPSCPWLHNKAYPRNAAGKDETSEYQHISHLTWSSRRCHIDGFPRTICH